MSNGIAPALYAFAGLALFAMGCFGVFRGAHPLRKILALNIASSGVFLVLVAIASRAAGLGADPVPQAMVLTGLVVSVSATALAVSLLLRIAPSARALRDTTRGRADAR